MELRETKSIIMALGLLLVLALVPMAFADENQTGTLDVSSTPSGANIYLNSVLMGQTPLSLTNVSEGNHTLNLTKEGYNDYVAIVGVTVNQTTTVNATLTALPLPITTGTLAVSSVPSGANIYLNNALKGQSPLTILNLSAGNYTLNLTKSGYNDYAATVAVVAEQTTNVNVSLVALPQPNETVITTGTLFVNSSPIDAEVYLNNVEKGNTPLTLYNLSAGNYSLKIEKDGYYDYLTGIVINANQTTSVSAMLTLKNASDDDENETDDDDDEVHNIMYRHGAKVRLLQLEKSIGKNILKGNAIIDAIDAGNLSINTTGLKNIISEMEALKTDVHSADLNASSSELAKQFVDYKHDAIALSKEFRDTLRSIVPKGYWSLIERAAKNEYDNDDLKKLKNEIKESAREYNTERLRPMLGLIGAKATDLADRLGRGEISSSEARNELKDIYKNLDNKSKNLAKMDLKEENSKKAVFARAVADKVREKQLEREQERVEKRLEKVREMQSKLEDRIESRGQSRGRGGGNSEDDNSSSGSDDSNDDNSSDDDEDDD